MIEKREKNVFAPQERKPFCLYLSIFKMWAPGDKHAKVPSVNGGPK